jgi:hypothetical protein
VQLYEEHGTLPHEVDALDPAFVAELMARRQAEADHELFSRNTRGDAEAMQEQLDRKMAIVRWREAVSNG